MLSDPISIAIGMGPKCRGSKGYRSTSPSSRSSARRGRTYSDPLYVNTPLFTITSEPDKKEKDRRQKLMASRIPFVCGDITFYPLEEGGWQSSGGSRIFDEEELTKALTEAGMI